DSIYVPEVSSGGYLRATKTNSTTCNNSIDCTTQWSLTDGAGNVYTFAGIPGGPWALRSIVDLDGNPTVYEYYVSNGVEQVDGVNHAYLVSIKYNYYDVTNTANTG